MAIDDAFLKQLEIDIKKYTQDKKDEIKKAVHSRTLEMKNEIKSKSPVRADTFYKKTGETKPYLRQKIYPPGTFKAGWVVSTLRDDNNKYLQAVVQSKNQKPLAHLIDQGHKIVTRNAARAVRGEVKGLHIVVDAQTKYTAIIKEDIKKILNK